MSTDTNIVRIDNKFIRLCAVDMNHPTMLDGCGEFDHIRDSELYGVLRSGDIKRVLTLVLGLDDVLVAVEYNPNGFGYEEPPAYYRISWNLWSNFIEYYCNEFHEHDKLDWRVFGF